MVTRRAQAVPAFGVEVREPARGLEVRGGVTSAPLFTSGTKLDLLLGGRCPRREAAMKPSLCAGLTFEFSYQVPEQKTVPHVYPESPLFQAMPHVFATAYLVGLFEWACMEAMQPHLEPGEQSVGVDIRISHTAATPPGLTVTVQVALEAVEGRKLTFRVSAHDGVEAIGEGTHQRFVIQPERFLQKVAQKATAGH